MHPTRWITHVYRVHVAVEEKLGSRARPNPPNDVADAVGPHVREANALHLFSQAGRHGTFVGG
jgi:hypothetical protein